MRHALFALCLVAGGCAAPERIGRHRSPLVEAPTGLFTPEGRSSPLPPGPLGPPGGRLRGSLSGEELARSARELVGARELVASGRRFPADCTGLARAVYWSQGVDLVADGGEPGDGGVTTIWRYAARHGLLHHGKPRPGDLVFYRETWDKNGDGRDNDGLTHVGVVEGAEDDGTVAVIHRVASGVVRYRMNLDHPLVRRDPASGRILNDYLRDGRGKRSRTAGELFAAYGTLAARE